jgi:outer membrane protein assembly factor BamB
VGCVDAARGSLAWTKPRQRRRRRGGDERLVFGTESDGRVVAWKRDNGERAWTTDKLLHRGLGTPLAVGRSVAVGDDRLRARAVARGRQAAHPPVHRRLRDRFAARGVGNTLVVVTRNGGVYGFVPQ